MEAYLTVKRQLRGRKAIRVSIKRDYRSCKGRGGYNAVGRMWGVSGGMVHKIINNGHWPKDKKIEMKILIEASRRGIPLGNRGGRDLWAMSPEELLWRLQNREEYDNNKNPT